ncbi:phage portal protein [Microbacterium sp. W4I20]|uniref:phage portal protein n=1 Tax=Microbacterium sp. W4I20 TaxID=3042262 RepID=UPI0027886403|nr:phage portal protein [Microbacterium sp. W4I20]MDQ0726818.1 hypothetical protein [Microbacterium sp. W4I20]
MVDETLRVPGLSEDETVTVNFLAKQLKDKTSHNRKRSDLYDGKSALRQVGTIIPPQYHRLGLALGWTAKGVDGLGRRCTLEQMVWADGDLDSLGMPELEDSNFLLSELSQGRTDSLIHGISYLITTQGDVSDDEPKALVHAKDALNATGEWNNRKRRLDNLLSVTSRDRNKITGFVLYLDGETINADLVDGSWELDRSEHPWHVPVDPLVYKPRSSKRMGRSRITPAAISHQYAAVRELVRLEAHMDVFTIPQLILLGANEAMFKNPDGSYKASWQIALGRALAIPDDDDPPAGSNGRADVQHIAAQSPAPHLADLNALAKLEAREYDLPDSAFALTDMANPTSADSYNASREDLIAEAEGATDDWSVPIRRRIQTALAIQNGLSEIPKEWASIDTQWRSPVYLSRAAVADAGAKQVAAAPEWMRETTVGLEVLGYSQQQIERALAERDKMRGRQSAESLIAARQAEVPNGDGAGVESSTDPAG